MTDAWIGIDLGTQSIRVIVLGATGERLARSAAPVSSTRHADGRHEQDPVRWLTLVEELLKRATAALPPGVRVRALAVSGTSGTIVPLDDDGRPTGPAVMYDDRRGAPYTGVVQRAGEHVWERLGYRIQPTWGLPRLLAMRAEQSDTACYGHQPDVVNAWLTGRRTATDLSSALKTGADLDHGGWPTEVLATLRVSQSALPELAPSGTALGTVTSAVARLTGLPDDCLVVAGSTDGCAAQFAAGALRPGTWNSVLGTTLVLKGFATERRGDPLGAVYAHRAPFSAGWLPGGASNTGARAITELLPDADLPALTAAMTGRSDVPVAYPLVGEGERFPFVSDRARAFWTGSAPPADDADRFRAIAFGIAYVERLAFDALASLGYDTTGSVALTGGGARNPWWNALRAAMLDRPCVLPAETEGAAGMALLAAAGARAVDQPDALDPLGDVAAALLDPPTPIEPLTIDASRLQDGYDAFRSRIRPWLDREEPRP